MNIAYNATETFSSEHAMQEAACSKWVGLFKGREEVHLLKRQVIL
jgi:hypothetical protein